MEAVEYYRALTRRMVTSVMLVSFLPLLLFGGIVGYQFQTSYREKTIDHLRELVQKHEQNIDAFLYEKLSYIRVMARHNSLKDLSNEDFLQERLITLQNIYGGVFVDLGVVDFDGRQIAYAGPFQLMKANYSDADWFKEAINCEYSISNVFMGLRNQPHFIVTAKRESDHGRQWVLRATIDFVAFNSLVENLRIGETGSAFIMNRQGEFQTTPRVKPSRGNEFFLGFLAESSENTVSAPLVVGGVPDSGPVATAGVPLSSVTVTEDVDFFGEGFIYVMSPLKNSDWILVFQQNSKDAFKDLYQARRLALLILFGGCLAIGIQVVVMTRRMVRRIKWGDRERDKMNEQVIEAGKLASVGELAAGIAHEINNPVAVMVEEAGWIDDILAEPDFPTDENLDELKRALRQIRTQGARCKEITHKLLSFARKTDPHEHEVDMNELLEEIISLCEQRARYSNVKINKNFAGDLPPVLASPSELQQVFLNLINNGVDSIGANGGTVEVITRTEGKYVVVDVADTGAGIPKVNLGRIFDPFFTTKPVGKGTGLGLSICYGIIKKLDGEISVNSAVGMGTTFHVRLPFRAQK
jgi:two-component system, NtrC family, sensor kinase